MTRCRSRNGAMSVSSCVYPLRAEPTMTSRGAATEPSETARRAWARDVARCRSRSSDDLSAHCRSSKLRHTGCRVAISTKNADRRENIVGLAAIVDLAKRFAGQVFAEFRCDAQQLAAIIAHDSQQPRRRFGR